MKAELCQKSPTLPNSLGSVGKPKVQPGHLRQEKMGDSAEGRKDLYGSKTYWSWVNMNRRCYKSYFKDYSSYGGKGIEVCNEWKTSFANFVRDMGVKPEGCLLDRIDRSGNYEPRNCRWADAHLSALNRSSTRFVGWDGEVISLTEAANRLGRSVCGLGRFLDRHPVYSANASLVKMRTYPKWCTLSRTQIRSILEQFRSGIKQSEMSRRFNMPYRLIHRIVHGKRIRYA